MPLESPLFYGMHNNAEIGFRTTQCNQLFGTLQALRPKEKSDGDDDTAASPMQIAETLCNEIFEDVKEVKYEGGVTGFFRSVHGHFVGLKFCFWRFFRLVA